MGMYGYVVYNSLISNSLTVTDSSHAAHVQNDRLESPSLIVILSVSEGSDNEQAGYARVVKRTE